MQTRRKFLATAGSTIAVTSTAKAAGTPLLSFGLMADCQYADAETRGSRFYRESPRKLAEAVDELNRRELAFTFHLGDFIDRDFESFDDLAPIMEKLKSPLRHALGNHDFDVADEFKAQVPGKLGLERGYYSFRRAGFHFIVIDTTEISPYRNPASTAQDKAAEAELGKLKSAGSLAAKPSNGRPGDDQIAWLEGELIAAKAANQTALVFGHHPILPFAGHSIWNATALDEILQKHRAAKLYINGHNHAGGYANADGFHYLTLDGMLETKDQNAFAVVDLYSDRLELTGFGRQESQTLEFRTLIQA